MNQSSSTIKRKNQMHTRNNKNSRLQLLRQLAPALAVAIAAYMVPFSALAQSPTTAATAGKMEMGTNSDASMKMRKSMEDMQQKMAAMPATGNPDINFAMMMVAHHQGAIDMAQAEIDTGKDPAMIKAAKKIISAQKKEIAQFEAWLKKNPHPMK